MSILVGNPFFLDAGTGATGYQISRSLRFNSSDSAYLSRTPASAGNRKTWTWAAWVKRSAISTVGDLFSATNGTEYDVLQFLSDDRIRIYFNQASNGEVYTASVFRDPSAWYHIVLAVDTTQSTLSNRVKLYVNNVQQSLTFTVAVGQNYDTFLNSTNAHAISRGYNSGNYFNGYLADVHFIDGQALDPSSFVETSATTGQLIPKQYTGSFGTNGFWLKFSDTSAATATTLGKDYSGNSNNWTPNNLSVTAGAGNDSLTDTPTSYGTDTGAGGEVRGNYSTLNPLQNATSDTFSNGNLEVVTAASGNYGTHTSTIATPLSGKWYAELTIDAANGLYTTVGLVATNSTFSSTSWPGALNGVCYAAFNGNSYVDTVSNAYGSIFGYPNDVVGIAYDADNGTVKFYLNGVSQGTISNVPVRPYYFGASDYWGVRSCTYTWNFGQRAWTYPANASGFKALCDTSLPAPVVAKPSTVMDVKLYTGNGTSQTISGLGFSPDLVWVKCRSVARSNFLFDTVRGAAKYLISDTTGSEVTDNTYLTAFTSDGFSVDSSPDVNRSATPIVAWAWDAGSSTVTNTQGSITSQVRANASAGFSIVTYSGNSSTATVGHGLNVAPSWIIIKNRTSAYDWIVYANESGTLKQLYLNLTLNASSSGLSLPSSTTFNLPGGGASGSNETGKNYVAYCFAPVAGYSSFGSYTGSSDLPFIFTGFRTRWLLIKRTNDTSNWTIIDTQRDIYNVAVNKLFADTSTQENVSNPAGVDATNNRVDILSNGFKHRDTNTWTNGAGSTYIYAAFAESPFQYARAR